MPTPHSASHEPAALERRCPNGCGHLIPISPSDLRLWLCLNCAGVYLTPEALKGLRRMPQATIQHLDSELRPANKRAARAARQRADPRPCPNCRTLMQPYTVPGHAEVTLDQCAVCDGIWADDDELEAASISLGPEAELHFNNRLSAGVRDAIAMNLYIADGHPEPPHPELVRSSNDVLSEVFPTFATWVRRSTANHRRT